MRIDDKAYQDHEEVMTAMYNDFEKFIRTRAAKKNEGYFETGIHVSGLTDCIRKVVMKFYNFDAKEKTLAELLMFELADFVHDLLAQWAAQSDEFNLIAAEGIVSDGLPEMIEGKLDLLMHWPKRDLLILTDTKTTHPNNFEIYFDKLLKKSHKVQINTYRMGETVKGRHPDVMFITYWDRGGTHAPAFFGVEEIPDAEIKQRIEMYQTAVQEYENSGGLPPLHPLQFSTDKNGNLFARRPWNCNYCEFCDVSCQSYGDKFPLTDDPKPKSKKIKIGKVINNSPQILEEFAPIEQQLLMQYLWRKKEGDD